MRDERVHPRAPVAQHTACGASGRQRETTSATWQAARTMPATWQAYRCVLDFDGPLARTAMQRCTQRALNGTINEVPTKGMLRVHSGYTPGMQGRCSNSTQGVVQRGFRRCTQRVLKGYAAYSSSMAARSCCHAARSWAVVRASGLSCSCALVGGAAAFRSCVRVPSGKPCSRNNRSD